MAKHFLFLVLLLNILFVFKIATAEKIFGYDVKHLNELVWQHKACYNISNTIGKSCFVERFGNVPFKVIDRIEKDKGDDLETCCVKREWLECVKLYLSHPDCAEVLPEMVKPLAEMQKYANENSICSPKQLHCLNGMPQLSATEICSEKKEIVHEKCMNAFNELPYKVVMQIIEHNNFTTHEACCGAWDLLECRAQIADEPSCFGERDELIVGFREDRLRYREKYCVPEMFNCKSGVTVMKPSLV